jgi:hypothetical protein
LNWPDSPKTEFSWQCKETLVRTHDWWGSYCQRQLMTSEVLAIGTIYPHS